MIIDTHSHIYLNKNQSIDEIVSGLKNDGIEKIISIGIDLETSKKCIEMARSYPGIVYATVGIHPCDVKEAGNTDEVLKQLEKLYLENKDLVVGIGETGYDFYHNSEVEYEQEKHIQEQFFEIQIKLAKKYSLPLIIHTRNSKNEVFETLQKNNAKKYILHCFSEDYEFTKKKYGIFARMQNKF